MNLMTADLKKQFPMIGATEGMDPTTVKIVAKYFDPTSGATWYAVEFDGVDQFFGWSEIFPGCGEYGYFSLQELQSAKGPLGLGIERDLYFENKTMACIKGIDF